MEFSGIGFLEAQLTKPSAIVRRRTGFKFEDFILESFDLVVGLPDEKKGQGFECLGCGLEGFDEDDQETFEESDHGFICSGVRGKTWEGPHDLVRRSGYYRLAL